MPGNPIKRPARPATPRPRPSRPASPSARGVSNPRGLAAGGKASPSGAPPGRPKVRVTSKARNSVRSPSVPRVKRPQ